MQQRSARVAPHAGLAGAGLWTGGAVATLLGELEWRGAIATNPIPAWVGVLAIASGAALFGVVLLGTHRTHPPRRGGLGRFGYGTAMLGLALALLPIWPLVFLGPLLVAVGVTFYGLATTGAPDPLGRFGAWLHTLCIPAGLVWGLAFPALGFDGGLGPLVSIGMVIGGFVFLGLQRVGPGATLARAAVATSPRALR
ncbi:MAG: hypothetical protein ABR575_10110 [Actinomycetota bacterium]